jgi:nitrite reductase/ring-hydroxylating ferredoxin subunit
MREPKWKQDFPIHWEDDHYVTRRELAKFLTLGSALLVGANGLIALFGRLRGKPATPQKMVAQLSTLAPGSSLTFRYPTEEDPCILVRGGDGKVVAYSQVCTHLSCAVVYRDQELFCPCHHGAFSCAEGLPTAGPPTRRLPRIRIDQRGDELWAVGVEV